MASFLFALILKAALHQGSAEISQTFCDSRAGSNQCVQATLPDDGVELLQASSVLHQRSPAPAPPVVEAPPKPPAAEEDESKECADTAKFKKIGYDGKGHKVFWSKNSCMTVMWCLDTYDFTDKGKAAAGKSLLKKGGTKEDLAKQWELENMEKQERYETYAHGECAKRINTEKSGHYVGYTPSSKDAPGCTQIMMPFVQSLRTELAKLDIDLYGDFADEQLICENTVAKKHEWGTPPNQASIDRQLAFLKRGVAEAEVFMYFNDNKGGFCDAEKEEGTKKQHIVLDFAKYESAAEIFIASKGKLGAAPDPSKGDHSLETEGGKEMAAWFCAQIKTKIASLNCGASWWEAK